jgi:hypothetical protein
MGIHVNAVLLVSVVFVWLLVYHLVYSLMAIARDDSLVCWSFGPLGLNAVTLRQPPLRQVCAQLGVAGLAVALAAYTSLFVLSPSPIAGLDRSLPAMAVAVLVPVAVVTVARLVSLLRQHRLPVWGEARVLAEVQRNAATGALIFFTPGGRAFLRDRFNATPGEFVRMLRG